eukprot:Pompholyxophrys_punicea_v1_NODE_318_length_2275_cov_16.666216.p1 type:complete len:166 gc:universal NODE_318_length_2275_cov_16.666216:1148-1645(+)
MPCHAMPCHAMPSHAMPSMPCHAMPSHAMPSMPCYPMPCHPMPCHPMPCHPMRCHLMLCHPCCQKIKWWRKTHQWIYSWIHSEREMDSRPLSDCIVCLPSGNIVDKSKMFSEIPANVIPLDFVQICSKCRQKFQEPVELSCGHLYHNMCLPLEKAVWWRNYMRKI